MNENDMGQVPAPAAAEPPAPLRPKLSTILALVVALAAAGIALGQLQGLLQGMHLSGRPAASIGGLNRLLSFGGDPNTTATAVSVWREYSDATAGQGTANAHEVAAWAVAVDSFFFAPLYALALFLFLLRARRQMERWRAQPPADVAKRLRARGVLKDDLAPHIGFRGYRRLATVGIVLITAGFAADELENLANLKIIDFGWQTRPDFDRGGFHALVWWLWLAGGAKWLFDLLAIGASLVLAWVLVAGRAQGVRQPWIALRAQLHLLRFQLILVALMAVVPFAHEQIPDLIRRWGVGQLALAIGLVALFALTTWLVGRRLLVCGQWQPSWSPRRRTIVRWLLFWGLLVLAAAQGLAHVFSNGRYQPGWGLAVPAVIVAALALLGALLPEPPAAVGDPFRGAPLAPGAAYPRLPRALAAFAVIALGFGILHASFGYSVYAQSWTWKTTPVVALALVLAGAAAAHLFGREPLLGAALGTAAGLVLLRIEADHELWPPVLVVASLLLIAAGWRLYRALGAATPIATGSSISRRVVAALATIFALFYAAVVAFPLQTGERVGVVAILLFFVLVLTCAGALLVWVTPVVPVPRALRLFRVYRFPIVALLVVWFFAASWLDSGGYHNVRLKDAKVAAAGITLDQAFRCWLGKNGLADKTEKAEITGCATAAPARAAEERGLIPLILVATTGGGIRAAYWTDLVLDCAFEVASPSPCPDGRHRKGFGRSDRLFALSGISGGSLGLTEYAAYLSEKQADGPKRRWVEKRLGADALSPSGAWWLLVEIPRTFLQFRSPTDRAGILERGWEDSWPKDELGKGLLALWRSDPHQPLLLLNGTSVEDGCRFETSPLNGNVEFTSGTPFGCRSIEPFDRAQAAGNSQADSISPRSVLPATRDLVDFLCGDKKDVRLSTAALLSARFPFVNPSARVRSRCTTPGVNQPVAYVVDGGYLDTSGASPIVELMAKLQPLVDHWNRDRANVQKKRCIVPLLIQIDNGFAAGSPREPRRPGELLVPLKTIFATRGGREAEGRVGAALLFATTGKPPGARYAHFVNEAHPGPRAPLGWTQSHVSERELIAQLGQEQNKAAFEQVQRWLTPGGITCPPGR